MAWVRVDPDAPLHPKMMRVGVSGFGFFVASLCYANHYLTDGFIHQSALPAVFPGTPPARALKLAVLLTEAGLWHTADKGWTIHDYHRYQPTKAEVKEGRAAAYAGKVIAGQKRASTATRILGRFTSTAPAETPAPPPADHQQTDQQAHQQDTSPVLVLVPDTENLEPTTLSGERPTPHTAAMNGDRHQARELLAFLNEKTGRTYRPVPENLKLIEARLKSGATPDNIRGVIARKAREWSTDPKMRAYLRPATLFNATKFEQYLGERTSV